MRIKIRRRGPQPVAPESVPESSMLPASSFILPLDPARVFRRGIRCGNGVVETQGALRTVTMDSGSRKCEAGCGKTISANKKMCMKCWTFALAQVHARFIASQAANFREGSD
jgi:hypothetical protein